MKTNNPSFDTTKSYNHSFSEPLFRVGSKCLTDCELSHIQNLFLFNIDQLSNVPKNTLCFSSDKDFLKSVNTLLEDCLIEINNLVYDKVKSSKED